MSRDHKIMYRVQDDEGRGPYRPGVTVRWSRSEARRLPAIQDEFGLGWLTDIPPGWHAGCGFRTPDEMAWWFLPVEMQALSALGYRPVVLRGCRILRQSAAQVVFARPRHLTSGAVEIPWPCEDRAA